MKFPNHIILENNSMIQSTSSQYWVLNLIFSTKDFNLNNVKKTHSQFNTRTFKLKNIRNKSARQFTLTYNLENPALGLSQKLKKMYKSLYHPRPEVTHKNLTSKNLGNLIYRFLTTKTSHKDYIFAHLISKSYCKKLPQSNISTNFWTLFTVNFLRKEKIYTKLKYSRTPQYDVVSGGVAAIFAGFLGFLICEKFGLELLDSGDFYFFFMYLVFFCFFCKLLLTLIDGESSFWNVFSLKWLFAFYKNILFFLKR